MIRGRVGKNLTEDQKRVYRHNPKIIKLNLRDAPRFLPGYMRSLFIPEEDSEGQKNL
jgi:hypothetical protein